MQLKSLTLLSLCTICCTLATFAFAQSKLPFTGKRYFNFTGGACCEQNITIKKSGQVKIQSCGISACVTNYTGKYRSMMTTHDGYILQIKGDKIYQLDKNGRVKHDCPDRNPETDACVVELLP